MGDILRRIEVIKALYGVHPQCYLVAMLLATEFKGEIWYNNDHCITRIKDQFWDRKGLYDGSLKTYLPLKNYGIAIEHTLVVAMVEWLTFEK